MWWWLAVRVARRFRWGRWLLAAIPAAFILGIVLLMAAIVGIVSANQGNCSGPGTSVGAPPPGALSAVQLVTYFEGAGWSPNASGGIVGNMAQEDSTLDPAAAGGGLVQNLGSKLAAQTAYDVQHGLDPASEAGQLEFLLYYVPLQSWWTSFDGAPTPQDAALWFQNGYEQCSGAGTSGTDQVGGGLCNPANRQTQAAAVLASSGGSPAAVPVTQISSGACSVQTGGYVNPLSHMANLIPERIDMGVDYSGTGEIDAIGDGQIINLVNAGWPGLHAFIEERLTGGIYAGKDWYDAECITPTVINGQTVSAGQAIGQVSNCGDGIEVGWSVGAGGTTLAASLHEQDTGALDAGDWSTAAGVSASRFLQSLGAPAGILQGGAAHGPLPVGYP